MFPTIIFNRQISWFSNQKPNQFWLLLNKFPEEDANSEDQRKLAALKKENCQELFRSNLEQNSKIPRSQEDYITQVSDEIDRKVTKKLSQEASRTKSLVLGALSRFDEFILNPLIQGHSGTTPETSRNTLGTNQGTNEDDSQCDPHPEASSSQSQNTRSSGPDDPYDMIHSTFQDYGF